jgi:two-component system phosphate regulon sensor histidine kinase PhoR
VSFVRRLVLGSIFILVLTVGILFWLAERSLRGDLEADIARGLASEAQLVREALPPDSLAWPATVRRLSVQTGHPITLIDRDGRVRADSDFPPGLLPAIQNQANHPEVRAALEGRRGVAKRRGESGDRILMYVAVPAPARLGAIRVAAALEQVDEVVARAERAVAGAALLALLVGSVLALAAGRSVAQPLVEIGSAANAIATGAPPRFPRSGIPDIDRVVHALREMHHQLGDRFAELRREQAETAALVESMVEGVIAADDRGRIVTANRAARRILGYEQDDPLPDLPELFRIKAAREVVDAALEGNAVQDREIEMDDRVLLMNARPLPSGGAVLVIHDLTEVRRLEAMRRDFVANVSHELKTPLTSISGYAETLLFDAPDPETNRKFLTTILANARRMQRLVDNLLDLARLEAGRWRPEREPLEIADLARDAWESMRDGSRVPPVEFQVEVGPRAETVVADPDALQQVLTNLMENALRYTPAGGRITCRSVVQGAGIAISVQDTGSGITPEHLPRIFERFYRSDPSRSREEGGTGLGLAIVKHLVEAHGGRVWAESERGVGTTITCWIPSQPVRQPAA